MSKDEYDVIVVGSGPNGLAAAVAVQQEGLSVLLLEGNTKIGGGLRSEELTLPGFTHDVCSAIHPLAVASPFFNSLPLAEQGLEYIYPRLSAAHPFDDGTAAVLNKSITETAESLGEDGSKYLSLIIPLLEDWPKIAADILGPFGFPSHLLAYTRFGLKAIQSASAVSQHFSTMHAKGLWAGMAGHGLQPLTNIASAAIAFVLLTQGHLRGWPIPKGGSHSVADALGRYFISLGGKIETNSYIRSLDQLPKHRAVLFDVTPRQLLEIAGHKLSSIYKWQLKNYRYGMGVFKVDWAINEPIPFKAESCRLSGTVHLGNTFEEIANSEQLTWKGQHVDRPFVLLAQQSNFDATRSPEGKYTAWAYCHVPNGSTNDMTAAIEAQVERFAPGFKETILAKHTMNTKQMQLYNPNYIGGDINGGVLNIRQLFTRPALRSSPYRTSTKGIYICSSSTPPGGGVHGMCGYYAAKRTLADIFKIKMRPLVPINEPKHFIKHG
ncbi:MAG TPA: NAD(P)/FAD-dependent oxidoreductase [Chryseolinea sp.]|nr:NAD(P)/FAD-dependent oxidoreductase [Chryseolinea sp.]